MSCEVNILFKLCFCFEIKASFEFNSMDLNSGNFDPLFLELYRFLVFYFSFSLFYSYLPSIIGIPVNSWFEINEGSCISLCGKILGSLILIYIYIYIYIYKRFFYFNIFNIFDIFIFFICIEKINILKYFLRIHHYQVGDGLKT